MMGDCEAADGSVFAQTVNAWSSLGYGVAAAVIGWASFSRRAPRVFLLLAAFTALEGVGSVLFHGRPSDAGQLLHDGALLAIVGFVAGWHLAVAPGARLGSALGVVVTVVAALGPSWLINAGLAVAIATVVVAEATARRRRRPRVWTAGPLVLLAVAVGAWAAGRSDSPLCAPQSLVQIHGAWHVLSAAVVVVWADRVSGARLLRELTDVVFGAAAMAMGHTFFRSVEVVGREHLPRDRPVLLIANHPNGFVDPVIVTAAVRRLPRFLAKAALWRVPPARPLLAFAGVLPIHRSGDGDDAASNDAVFASCYAALAAGGTVAIFPEGTTDNRAQLDRIRSGAARIALGALAAAPDLVVVPVGVAFENRIVTRSRALVVIGAPIVPQPATGDGRAAAAALTADFAAALAAVSPEFESVDERDLLRAAATAASKERGVTGRQHRGWPSFGEIELLARRVAAAPAARRAAVADAYRAYAARLQLIGMTEAQVRPRATRRWGVVAVLAALAALGSIIVPAALIHLPALLLIVLATGLVHSVATKGTVRLLVGLVAGVLTWAIAGLVIGDGWGALLAGIVVALQGQLALALWTPFVGLLASAFGWWRARDRAELLPPVLADRAVLVDAVFAAAGEDVR